MDRSIDVRRGADGVLGSMDELLRRPQAGFERAAAGVPVGGWAVRVGAGSLACCVLYGGAAGFFAGGLQIGLAAIKAPLVIAWSALICVPSLYVFGLLAGAPFTRARFVVTIVGFVGMLALVLIGLLPIEWLFSVSTRSLTFAIWLHLLLWAVALGFGVRFLRAAIPEMPASGALLWLVLFCAVSFQVATLMRPLLWRAPGAPVVERGKLFFVEHFRTSVE